MRMTVKGQVTIPVEFRQKLGLKPGDDVRFETEGDKVVVLKGGDVADEGQRFEAWLDDLREAGRDCSWTTDEILDMTRGSERRDPYPGS